MVEQTLTGMADGGIHDQLGGGFHRYSVDRTWLVPHFEKMLYDNALFASVYSLAFHVTDDPRWREVAERTFDYLVREMRLPHGRTPIHPAAKERSSFGRLRSSSAS
jgi:uncharacterized protein YyaL (SSP411 family)